MVSVCLVFGGGDRRNEGRLVWKSERGEVEGMPACPARWCLEFRAAQGCEQRRVSDAGSKADSVDCVRRRR